MVDVSNHSGQHPLHLAAANGHTEVARCLCLAGCRLDVKNDHGVTPDIVALAQGHKDTSDLLKKLKRESCCDDYIEQLIPTASPIGKIKLKVFGSSGVGKTALIDSLKAKFSA